MFLKLFSFSKTEKSPKIIEDRINSFLENNAFKHACQSESTKSGKFYLSIFAEPKSSGIRAKVFKDTNTASLEERVNEFLKEGNSMRWSCQSSSTTSIYMVVFYELRKADDQGNETNEDQG